MHSAPLSSLGRTALTLLVPLSLTACGDGQGTALGAFPTADASAEDAAPDAALPDAALARDGGTTSPRAPRILSLKTNLDVLSETGTLTFTAVVTDPDGIDDLIGGQLLDPATGRSYGAFATSAAEGAYSLGLTWGQIAALAPIETPVGGAPREFRAEFFDSAGNKGWESLTIRLACADALRAACGSQCVDLQSDKRHCGGCGKAITDGARVCIQGKPACYYPGTTFCPSGSAGACVDLATSLSHCGACDNAVLPPRKSCVKGQPTCPTSTPDYCSGTNTCVALASDESNCGACGKVCPALGAAKKGALCDSKICYWPTAELVYGKTCAAHCPTFDSRLRCIRAYTSTSGSTEAPCSQFLSSGRCECGMDPL